MEFVKALAAPILCLLLATSAAAKPEAAARLDATLASKPAPGKPVTVTVSLRSKIDLSDIKLAVGLPDGVEEADDEQTLLFTTDITADETQEFNTTVIVTEPGNYAFVVQCVAKHQDELIRLKRALYLVVEGDVSVFTSTSMTAARRQAILQQYRHDHKVPQDAAIKVEDLPEDVRAALDALNKVEAAKEGDPGEEQEKATGNEQNAETQQ
jgi:hypothetical protein